MKQKAQWTLLTVGSAMVVVGCASGEELTHETESPMLVCDDAPPPYREEYDLEAINRRLKDHPQVAQLTGLRSVSSCAEARAIRDAEDSLLVDREDEALGASGLPEEPENLEEKIWRGVDTYRPYHGFIRTDATPRGCSGVFIAPDVLLTAAHCIPNAVAAKSRSGMAQRCGYAVGNQDGFMQGEDCTVWRHADYTGNGDAERDIGLVKFRRDVADAGARIYTGALEQFERLDIAGYGVTEANWFDNGTLREDPEGDDMPVDARMDHQINSYAEQGVARACTFDDGAPLMKRAHNKSMVVALVSNFKTQPGCGSELPCCTEYKGRMEHTRLRLKIGWIEERIGDCTLGDTGDYYICR